MNFTANYAGATYTHGYTLNDKNQRTGITLADGKNWNFSYDNIGQVTGAMLNNSGDLLNTYSYNYDQIGNRIQAAKDNNITSYTSNIVNQYIQISTVVPTYDHDGNMLTNGEWSYTWNGENRMILAETTTRKVEFAYDYMGRCFERKEYTAANGSWNLDKTVYIVYDEYKQIAEYVNGELHQQYVWDVAGLDTVAFMGKNNSTYMYWTDGNKNVLKLFDATGEQGSYSYDPFGKVATAEGLLATDNPFRFSSEYHNDITELVEYIYRKYDPALGRWINRDPIEEQGGWNLYVICKNNEIIHWDTLGTTSCKVTVYMGHNSEISKLINCQQNDFCKNISLGCGLDENNVVRKNSINGKFMPRTIGKVEFYSAMKNSPIPADYEERNNNGIADYQQIRSFIASQYQGHDTSIYENYATTVYYYVRAHIKLGITEALRLTKNKRCKRCCPNGIDFEVIIVNGMSIIYDKNVSKNFPTLEMLGNLKLNFPCR